MIKKYFKYILLTFLLMFGISLNVEAKAELIDIQPSAVKTNYCKYEYDGLTIKLFEGFDGKLEVTEEGKVLTYDSYNIDYLKGDSYIKQTNCPNIYTFLYTMGPAVGEIDSKEKKVLYFFFDKSDSFEVFNTTITELTTLSGTLKKITTSCVYEAEGAKFTAKYNPATNKMRYPVSGVYDTKSNTKKNWKYNADGLICRDGIVIDICGPGVYIRTKADAMIKTCYKSTDPGGIKITEKEDNDSKDDILYLSNICEDSANVVRVVRIIGYLLLIIKILVPIGLIIFGTINFAKAVISGKDEDTKKAAISLMWKFIAAVIVFVLPTIINFVFSVIDGATDGTEDYENCRICIFDPGECKIPD